MLLNQSVHTLNASIRRKISKAKWRPNGVESRDQKGNSRRSFLFWASFSLSFNLQLSASLLCSPFLWAFTFDLWAYIVTDEIIYRVFKSLESGSLAGQRELAESLGVSLGKANYCLRALMDKGLIKAQNFKNNSNKRAYLYYLTPRGIKEKSRLTIRFLERKIAEYEMLRTEIKNLQNEVLALKDSPEANPEWNPKTG